jgi:hypothetical protein
MLKFLKAAAAATVLCVGFGAQAATVESNYKVTNTINKLGTPIAFGWEYALDGSLSPIFVFDAPGTMTIFDDGTATISGTVYNANDAASGFAFDFNMDSTFLQVPKFKDVFDRAVEHGNERYFDFENGTAAGFGNLAGLDLTLSRFPVDGEAVLQMGGGLLPAVGANQHSNDFGASVWFGVESIDSATCVLCDNNAVIAGLQGEQADLVANLELVSTVPLPAGSVLLLSGLGLMAAFRRRS